MPASRRWTTFAVAIAVLIATPLAVVASDVFTDVPDSNVFHDDITWLADAGVTKGCNPPDNTEFCPTDEVTREQMAAFMHRLADNQVVDAGALDGAPSSSYRTFVSAANCGVIVVDPDTSAVATSCLPGEDGHLNPSQPFEALHLEIDAPAAGALQLSSTALAQATVAWTFTLDAPCPTELLGILTDGVNDLGWGTEDPGFSTSAFTTTSVGAGTHTIRLCGRETQDTDGSLVAASLTAQWTEGGSVAPAGVAGSPITPPSLLGG